MPTNYFYIGMNNLLQKDKQLIWHPFTVQHESIPENIFIVKAEGVYLYTADGRKILDAISSWWVNLHGHAHPALAKALYDQASVLEHVIFAGFTHQPAIQLAENLATMLPSNISKIFFSDNGSTANEVAIKMAIQFWHNEGIKKKKIVAFKGAYHGDTFGSMAVGDRSLFTEPFTDYLFEVEFLDFPTETNQESVLKTFEDLLKTNDVGVFIFEPLVQGAAGMRMYSADFLDKLIATAHHYDVICIADEVFTGFCRTGEFFASDYLTNKPDIIAISKGITGGTMPLGVTACTENIYTAYQSSELTKAFLHGHSYTANPLACAVANASYQLLVGTDCQQQIQMIAESHKNFIRFIKNHKHVKEVNSLGTILSLEVSTESKTDYSNSLRKKIYDHFISRDILLRPLGNIIYLVPPYVIQNSELEMIYTEIKLFLDSL